VAHQNGPVAVVRLDRLPHDSEQFSKGNVFRHCAAQRTLGINAGEFQCRRIKVCALKRLDVATVGFGDL